MANTLRDLLYEQGFRGDRLRTAWAVAMAESGGNAQAFNPRGRDLSYGLFQINMRGGLGPDRLNRYGLQSNEALYDPATNARVAFQMSGGGANWQPWTTFTGGAYRKWLDKFPGGDGGADTRIRQEVTQAFQSGPAGIVAGPNPVQLLAFRQQAAQRLLSQANSGILGQTDVSGGWLIQLATAKRQLAQADATHTAAEASARQYGGTTQPFAVEGGSELQNRVLAAATAQLGKPYVWGAETPSEGGFDCSGLIDWAYRQAGIKLPVGRLTTETAAKLGYSVKGKPMTAGDMLITNGGKHMVMYVGNGQVIAAPHRGEVVQYQPISRFQGDIVDVRRVLK